MRSGRLNRTEGLCGIENSKTRKEHAHNERCARCEPSAAAGATAPEWDRSRELRFPQGGAKFGLSGR